MSAEDRVPIPEIKRCWERASVLMPPSDPTNPEDPSVNLDTLAAIATAKWLASEAAEAKVEALTAALREIASLPFQTEAHKRSDVCVTIAMTALATSEQARGTVSS